MAGAPDAEPGERGEGIASRGTTARLFVATLLPDAVLDVLDALPRPEEPGVRWARRDQWHVTLRFLGTADVAAAVEAVRAVRHPVAVATLGPAVSRLGRSIVCAPVAGLDGLAAAVVAATATVGEPPDPRPFAGHVTLARLRHRGACGLAGHVVRATWEVDEVALVRSHLDPGGARYEVVERTPLVR